MSEARIEVAKEEITRLALADLLLLLARWLARPPDAATIGAGRAELLDLVSRAGLDREAVELMGVLHAAALPGAGPGPDAAAREHARLFEGATLCPANETMYVRRDKGAILADICGFYRAFGFEPARTSGEKADHVVTELEFTALLLVMESEASRRGDRDAEDVTRHALALFARDHLGEWLPFFCDHLEEATCLPAYRCVARLARGAWAVLGDRTGHAAVAPGGAPAALDPGTPYECGAYPMPPT